MQFFGLSPAYSARNVLDCWIAGIPVFFAPIVPETFWIVGLLEFLGVFYIFLPAQDGIFGLLEFLCFVRL